MRRRGADGGSAGLWAGFLRPAVLSLGLSRDRGGSPDSLGAFGDVAHGGPQPPTPFRVGPEGARGSIPAL